MYHTKTYFAICIFRFRTYSAVFSYCINVNILNSINRYVHVNVNQIKEPVNVTETISVRYMIS